MKKVDNHCPRLWPQHLSSHPGRFENQRSSEMASNLEHVCTPSVLIEISMLLFLTQYPIFGRQKHTHPFSMVPIQDSEFILLPSPKNGGREYTTRLCMLCLKKSSFQNLPFYYFTMRNQPCFHWLILFHFLILPTIAGLKIRS